MALMLLVISNQSFAQKKYKAFGKKFPAVIIVDPGQLCSTYTEHDIKPEEIQELVSSSGLTQDQVNVILQKSFETNWTNAMKDFSVRQAHQDIIKQYKAFLIGQFGNKYLLVIPSKLNGNLANGFVATEDFYIVVVKNGVTQ
jgi:hypothetical protein